MRNATKPEFIKTCFYCGLPMWLRSEATKDDLRAFFGIPKGSYRAKKALRYRRATKEHLHRKCEGGPNHKSNIVLACAYCNHSRGAATPRDHAEAMLGLVAPGTHPCQAGTVSDA